MAEDGKIGSVEEAKLEMYEVASKIMEPSSAVHWNHPAWVESNAEERKKRLDDLRVVCDEQKEGIKAKIKKIADELEEALGI